MRTLTTRTIWSAANATSQPTAPGRGNHIRAGDCPYERRSLAPLARATPLFARGASHPTLRFPSRRLHRRRFFLLTASLSPTPSKTIQHMPKVSQLTPAMLTLLTHYKKGRPFQSRLEASAHDRRKGAPKWTTESILAWTCIRQASRLRSVTAPERC